MKTSQDRQKSYYYKRRKPLDFEEGDHVYLKVTLVTGVGRALKSLKELVVSHTKLLYLQTFRNFTMFFMCLNFVNIFMTLFM